VKNAHKTVSFASRLLINAFDAQSVDLALPSAVAQTNNTMIR
jgi:hypothetical protein